MRIFGFWSGFLKSRRTSDSRSSESCNCATSGRSIDVSRVRGVDGFRPFRRQQLVQRLLVFGAGFAIHGDEKCLVAKRQHAFLEVLGHELRDLLNAVISGKEGAQPQRTVQDLVEFLDVGYAFGSRQGRKIPYRAVRQARSFRLAP